MHLKRKQNHKARVCQWMVMEFSVFCQLDLMPYQVFQSLPVEIAGKVCLELKLLTESIVSQEQSKQLLVVHLKA